LVPTAYDRNVPESDAHLISNRPVRPSEYFSRQSLSIGDFNDVARHVAKKESGADRLDDLAAMAGA